MTARHVPSATVALATLVLLSLLRPVGSPPGEDIGLSGWPPPPPPAPEATRSVSPSGRVVVPGTRDALGYVLPLDVRRARPDGANRSRPTTRTAPVLNAAFSERVISPDDGHTQNETSIAAVADTILVGWNHYTDTTLLMGVGRSTDAGDTWNSDFLAGHDAMSDPVVKAGGNGTWYFAYIARGGAFGGTGMDVFVRRSLDAGMTWQPPVPVTNDPDFNDKPYMDARDEDVLVGYADFGTSPSTLRAARSIDGGLSFQHDTALSVNSLAGNGACPVIDAAGTYYVFWRDSWQDSLWVSRSTDRGVSWRADRGIVAMSPLPATLSGGFRIVNLPSAAANPVTGDLLVVWNDQRFGDPDILSIRSTDGGDTWSAPVRVNDDAGAEAQWFPWIAFDEVGVAHVVWYDRRHDGTSIDVYVARSTDGGVTYEPNVRVTDQGFLHVPPWEVSLNFLGDYTAIAAAGGFAYPSYQDARAGEQDVYVSKIPSAFVSAPEALAPPRPVLAAHPNPFTTDTRILLPGAEDPSPVLILDVRGRLVRRLEGLGEWRWDGRDERGRVVAPGVYVARHTAPGGATLRLVRTP